MESAEDPSEIEVPEVSEPSPGLPAATASYSPAEHREHTRAHLAIGLAVLLGFLAVLLIVLTAAGLLSLNDAKDLGLVVFSPIVVLTGTALGFYFGVLQGDK